MNFRLSSAGELTEQSKPLPCNEKKGQETLVSSCAIALDFPCKLNQCGYNWGAEL